MAVRPHRHAPRWRSHALPARVAPMLAAIPSHAFTSHRSRVIMSGPAVGAAPPRTVSAVRRRPLHYVSTRRRGVHAALLLVPHRDPLRLLPPRAAPNAVASLSAGGGDRCRAGLRPSRPADPQARPHTRRSGPFQAIRWPPPPQAMRRAPVLVAKAPATRGHVARRRACHGASFALRVRSPPVGRCGNRPPSRATAPPPATPGVPDGKRQRTNEVDSPRSNARYERASSAATLPHIARVLPSPFRCCCASDGQRRKISYEGQHGSGCCAYPKTSRRRKIPPTCPFFAEEAPHKPKSAQGVITSCLRFRTGERR